MRTAKFIKLQRTFFSSSKDLMVVCSLLSRSCTLNEKARAPCDSQLATLPARNQEGTNVDIGISTHFLRRVTAPNQERVRSFVLHGSPADLHAITCC